MNSTKKEYMMVGASYPEKIGEYLLILEKESLWNICRDVIYISHSCTTYGYKDVRGYVYKDITETGGEIIHEELKLY